MRRPRKIRGPMALVGALAATAALLPASGLAEGARGGPVRHTFDGLTVTFPAGWQVLDHAASLTSQSNSILYASNQPIHFTCATTTVSGGTRSDCRGPLARLRANGALVQWDGNGSPGWNVLLDGGPGQRLTIDGLAATVQITRHGTCEAAVQALGSNSFIQKQEAVGSQETISAVVASPMPDNYLTFNACLRGPDLSGLTRSVMASLRSTKIARSP